MKERRARSSVNELSQLSFFSLVDNNAMLRLSRVPRILWAGLPGFKIGEAKLP